MSRLARQPITLPLGTKATFAEGTLSIVGPRGAVARKISDLVELAIEDSLIKVLPREGVGETHVYTGTFASHIRNMIKGVTDGFSKKLLIEGIGYRATLSGENLELSVGLSHPVRLLVPEGVMVTVEKNVVTVSGNDKERVGKFTALIREVKPPEPYKGKGIRYEGEVVRRKQGKKSVT